ncbi:hypothetical protein [Bradyrhizobium sp. B120]
MIWDVEQAHGFEHQGVGDVVKVSEAFSEEAAAQLADLENPR